MRDYYELAKPERTLTNVLTAAAGYLFAAHWHINFQSFIALLLGSTLVIASACVFNNLLDRQLDSRMGRTQKRALVEGRVSVTAAGLYAAAMAAVGFLLLAATNWLTFAVGVEAFLSYILLYGWAKRHTVYGTLVGTLPGGSSLVAGYTAAKNQLDWAALLLFLAMLSWQMAHFYAIAVYRFNDYKAAKVPVYPVIKGIKQTTQQIIFYIAMFSVIMLLLSGLGYTGYIFAAVMLALSLWWLKKAVLGLKVKDKPAWARGVFLFSLTVIMIFAVMVATGPILP